MVAEDWRKAYHELGGGDLFPADDLYHEIRRKVRNAQEKERRRHRKRIADEQAAGKVAARKVAKEVKHDAKLLSAALAVETAEKLKLEQALVAVRGELIDAHEIIFALKRELAAARTIAERMLTASSAVHENAGALGKALEEWAVLSQRGVVAEERVVHAPFKHALNTSRDAATSPAQADTPLVDADSPLSSQRASRQLEVKEVKLKLWSSKRIHAEMMDFVSLYEE